jgi:colanic acid biosynthesis glycosyl transferase WcaI
MRILVLGINYAPERTSVAPFTTGLSEHLASKCHIVKVITAFPYYPEWRIWDEYRGRITRREHMNGVDVRRVAHFIPWKASSLWQRLLHDFSFAGAALVAGMNSAECDIIYCSSPPPALALTAYVLSKWKGVPFTIKLTDLASEAAIATAILRPDGLALRLARALEGFLYKKAEAIFCLCDAFVEKLSKRGIPPSKLHRIPDWGDTEIIKPVTSDGSFRRIHGFAPNEFLVLHTGNMGKKQDLANVVRAAEQTQHDKNLVWVIVGQGEDRKLVEQEIFHRNLRNIRLLPLQSIDAMPQMYSAADTLLLNQKASVKDAVIPSKLLTYMSSGRPIIAAVDDQSEAARQIRRAGCGVIVVPEDPKALANGVLALRADPVLQNIAGIKGRSYAEANFTKALVLNAYDKFFESIFPPQAIELTGGNAVAAD